jgi:hypothetical protein
LLSKRELGRAIIVLKTGQIPFPQTHTTIILLSTQITDALNPPNSDRGRRMETSACRADCHKDSCTHGRE